MEKNNGKIAIAIVAMFVVALSIVGVTYAYFVSNVNTNTTDEVEVQAGILQVNYRAGNSLDTTGITIVPGWRNDGKMIYHPTESVDANGHISSVSIDRVEDTTYDANVKNPITFTITNTSEPAGKEVFYGIRLTNVDVTVDAVKVYLEKTNAHIVGGGEGIMPAGLYISQLKSDDDGNLYLSLPISITDAPADYSLEVEFMETVEEQDDQGEKIKFTVEVVGLQEVNGNYVTSSGATWITSFTRN